MSMILPALFFWFIYSYANGQINATSSLYNIIQANTDVNQSLIEPYLISKSRRYGYLDCLKECNSDINCVTCIYDSGLMNETNCYTYNDTLPLSIMTSQNNGSAKVKNYKSKYYSYQKLSNNKVMSINESCAIYGCNTKVGLFCEQTSKTCKCDGEWMSLIGKCSKIVIENLFEAQTQQMMIKSCNGTTFPYALDVKTTYNGQIYYYVSDPSSLKIFVFNQGFECVKMNANYDPQFLEIYQNLLFLVSNFGLSVLDVDNNFAVLNNIPACFNCIINDRYGFHYHALSNRLYNCGLNSQAIYVFYLNLTLVDSFTVAPHSPLVIDSYKNTFYVVTIANLILMIKNRVIISVITNSCINDSSSGIYIDTSGYMMLTCYVSKRIVLWQVNETFATYTGRFINTQGSPFGISFDPLGRLVVAQDGLVIYYN